MKITIEKVRKIQNNQNQNHSFKKFKSAIRQKYSSCLKFMNSWLYNLHSLCEKVAYLYISKLCFEIYTIEKVFKRNSKFVIKIKIIHLKKNLYVQYVKSTVAVEN